MAGLFTTMEGDFLLAPGREQGYCEFAVVKSGEK
jgi:hypothetical protein